MKPAPFKLARPDSLDEVLSLLARYGDECKLLAGGQSLVPLLNMRLARPAVLIDLNRLPNLSYATLSNGHLLVGALVRARALEQSSAVAEACPLIAESAGWVGHVEIRNRTTVCGSLAHADPSAELPLSAVALDAELVLQSERGERNVSASDFFVDYLTTALQNDEIVREVRFPVQSPASGWGFTEFARRKGDFALVSTAVLLRRGADGRCTDARVVLGGVGPVPVRARRAELTLKSEGFGAAAVRSVAAIAAADIDPQSDVQASATYRRRLAAVLVEDALTRAITRLPESD